MAVAVSLAGWWQCQPTLQSSGTDMVVVDFVQVVSQAIWRHCCREGHCSSEYVLDARAVVVAPKDISGSSSLYILSMAC